METVLYKHDACGEFTGIYAQIEDGRLTITQHDMGEFEREYSRDGEVESFVSYDVVNTNRLMRLLHVADGYGLLVALKKKFKEYEGGIKSEICNFCDEHGIKYQTQVYS